MLRIASMLCGFSILAVGCGASQHSQPQPKSTAPPPHALGAPQLLAHAPGLSLFAQDGDDIAWWSSGACPALHIEVLATRSDARIPPGRSCAISDDTGFPSVWSL